MFSHLSPEAIKAELAKIVTNASYLDKTPVLKNFFPMAWRILFTFVIQFLSENYSSTKHINSIQQIIVYYLITGTGVDIGEIIYSDLITKLLSKSRLKYIYYPRFISCALEVLLGFEYTEDKQFRSLPNILSNSYFSKDPSKVTDIELTGHMIAINNQKDSVFPLPISGKKKKAANKGLPSMVSNEGMVKTTLLPERPLRDKDSKGNKIPADMEPNNPTDADLSGTIELDTEPLQLKTFANVQDFLLVEDEMAQKSDDEEVFSTKEDIDEDTQADEEEHQSPPLNTNKPESSYTQDTDKSASDSSSPKLKKYDNILPLTERQLVKYLRKVYRVLFKSITEEPWEKNKEVVVSYAGLKASIEGYYEENVDQRDQTNKVIQAAMNSLDKNSITRGDLLNALNGVTETLKAIQYVIKEDLTLNKKVIEATKAYTKNSTHLTEFLTLIKNFDFQGLKSSVESLQATTFSQDKHIAEWAKKDTLDIKSMMTEIYQAFKVLISSVKPTETREVQPTSTIISTSQPEPSVPQREGKGIDTDDQLEVQTKLVKASSIIRPDPDAPIFVLYMINEEAKKIGIDPKKVISAKAGEKFKKARDAEMQVHKRQQTEKVKRLT
ncbi:hypothetical protein Tco_0631142 [Tanacetum coccineum]